MRSKCERKTLLKCKQVHTAYLDSIASKLEIWMFERLKENYKIGIRLKENYDIERMPRCDSFNLFYCGSIAGKPVICNKIGRASCRERVSSPV